MNLNKIKKIYMIGIKGAGMTMLAEYLSGQGIEIVGSDMADKYMTDEVLAKARIKVIEKFDAMNIPADADLIIYSTAYNAERNVEVSYALAGKTKTLTYAQALGDVFNQKYGIAVIGSHGKTTTSAWLGYVLDRAGNSPSVMVGATVPQFNGNSLIGKSEYLVIEADEYQNKLRHFQPRGVLLNNIDYDHPDFFPTPDDYQQVFVEFIKKLSGKGFLVANLDDPIIRKIAQVNCRGKVVTYGIKESADYVAYDIKFENGKQYFKVKLGVDDREDEEPLHESLGCFAISLPGEHNIYNALAVIATAIELGVSLVDIRVHLEGFTGATRRLQALGEFRGATLIDDYAHHPSEIKASLSALRQQYGQRRLVAAFHPHTFSRTKALLDDFATSFDLADEVIILDIYGSAREEQGGVSSLDLVNKLKIENCKSKIVHMPDLIKLEKYLLDHIEKNDVVVLMGAGDIFRVGENLLKSL